MRRCYEAYVDLKEGVSMMSLSEKNDLSPEKLDEDT